MTGECVIHKTWISSYKGWNLGAEICSTWIVGDKAWLKLVFQFIPNVLHVDEVRALCKLVKLFHTNLG